jgi:hypothetical protein
MRRTLTTLLAALLVSAGLVVSQAAPAQAAPAQAATECSRTWHYIKAGERNRNVKPVGEAELLYAIGIQSQDYWNQQLLFCRDPGWGPNHYAIYANATGNYWSRGIYPWLPIHAGAVAIFDPRQLFEVKSYDGNFFTIKSVQVGLEAYVRADRGDGLLLADRGLQLGGDNLFLIQPRNLLA